MRKPSLNLASRSFSHCTTCVGGAFVRRTTLYRTVRPSDTARSSGSCWLDPLTTRPSTRTTKRCCPSTRRMSCGRQNERCADRKYRSLPLGCDSVNRIQEVEKCDAVVDMPPGVDRDVSGPAGLLSTRLLLDDRIIDHWHTGVSNHEGFCDITAPFTHESHPVVLGNFITFALLTRWGLYSAPPSCMSQLSRSSRVGWTGLSLNVMCGTCVSSVCWPWFSLWTIRGSCKSNPTIKMESNETRCERLRRKSGKSIRKRRTSSSSRTAAPTTCSLWISSRPPNCARYLIRLGWSMAMAILGKSRRR